MFLYGKTTLSFRKVDLLWNINDAMVWCAVLRVIQSKEKNENMLIQKSKETLIKIKVKTFLNNALLLNNGF